jgi:AmmeMemoRadiSam system protein A
MRTDDGLILLRIARAAIASELGRALPAPEEAAWLREHGACFVTLKQDEKLRGCVGSLKAHRPLLDDVKRNAVAAALRDPRFTPLGLEELDVTSVEVSLLSALEPVEFEDERHALSQLRPGTDGLVFEYGYHQSTFLPQVWEDLPEPDEFMSHLKRKAGLPPDFWDRQVKLARYTVSKWSESSVSGKR